ncbi:MAG: MoxR family ATPase [Frankiaceae bacterium]|nr:MoxR family ATPase [Frankiaceae bacterium]
MTTSSAAAFPQRSRPDAYAVAGRLIANVERVVHGRRAQVELVVCAVLAGGHVLVEDVPGTGKTTLARAVARSLGGSFRRVQGTADLLPADITGSGVWEPERRAFSFVPGPLFAHVVLVDELNRTPPRTQSAFMEAMDEGAVTVDGVRHPLPEPFIVLATQNPLEQFGTYPLPEGQLDRFTVSLGLGANDPATERLVVREQLDHATVDELEAVTSPEELTGVRAEVRRTHVSEPVLDHALRIVEATRQSADVVLGASTRAGLTLVRCAQARATLAEREYVVPDDVKSLAPTVLGHRLVLRGGGGARRAQALVADLVATVPVPLSGSGP